MTLSNAEQYLLEMINRARLDPAAEAARFGISLNQGLSAGTIDATSKQVLAANDLLNAAAADHSLWMLATDIFSHTGQGGSLPWDRAADAGYDWSAIGENISWRGTSASSFDLETYVELHHQGLFLSSGHRTNILNDTFREIGLGQETGVFTSGANWTASMVTEVFGRSGSQHILTGVAYTDSDGDKFYSMGEGVAGVDFASGAARTETAGAGGYALKLTAGAAVQVTGSTATGKAFSATVDLSQGNVKLDLVNGTEFRSSGSLELGTGIQRAVLLGLDDLSLKGTAAANVLTGNAGANLLHGLDGNDVLEGGAGVDRLEGGNDQDRLLGGAGRDLLFGGAGNDVLRGGGGGDRLQGDAGDDTLTGDAGADRFVFSRPIGQDVVTDFNLSEGDTLQFNDAFWQGQTLSVAEMIGSFASVTAQGVLFDFGSDGSVLLAGLSTTSGLSGAIEIL